MSHKATSKLTPDERKEFEQYLEVHRMSEGKSLWKVVCGAMAKALLEIKESEIKSSPVTHCHQSR